MPGERNNHVIALVFAVLIVILMGAYILNTPSQQECPEQECNCSETCEFNQSADLKLYYLMPQDCSDCDKEMIDSLSKQLGVGINKYYTDSVPHPSLLILVNKKSTLAVATRRFNILQGICDFANYSKACELKDYVNTTGERSCLRKNNLSPQSVFYFYSKKGQKSMDMKEIVEKVEKQGYGFEYVRLNDREKMGISKKCLSNLTSFKQVMIPKMVCPATGEIKTGTLRESAILDFAKSCRDSYENQ